MSAALTQAKLDRYERLLTLGPPPPLRHIRKLARWLKAYAAIWAVTLDETTMMLRRHYTLESITEMANRPSPTFAMLARRQ